MRLDSTVILLLVFIIAMIIVAIVIVDTIIIGKVRKNSDKLKTIERLNEVTLINKIPNNSNIIKHYDNKSHFNKIEPLHILISTIRDDVDKFENLILAVNENRINYNDYVKTIERIMNQQTAINNGKSKFRKNFFIRKEKIIAKTLMLKPTTDLKVCVYMTYSSPKGQVNLNKNRCFEYIVIKNILEEVSGKYLKKDIKNRVSMVERGNVSNSLRYDILKRDNFKCVLCGASSEEGARLHVDHIHPISKGGKSDVNNLRTLCERCNIGKSNKIE